MKLLTPLQRRLYGYIRPYVFPYVLLLGAAMLVLSAASAGIPFIIKLVVDLVTNLKVGIHQLDAHGALKLREYSLLLAGLFFAPRGCQLWRRLSERLTWRRRWWSIFAPI